jgi:hypothetical protein
MARKEGPFFKPGTDTRLVCVRLDQKVIRTILVLITRRTQRVKSWVTNNIFSKRNKKTVGDKPTVPIMLFRFLNEEAE